MNKINCMVYESDNTRIYYSLRNDNNTVDVYVYAGDKNKFFPDDFHEFKLSDNNYSWYDLIKRLKKLNFNSFQVFKKLYKK